MHLAYDKVIVCPYCRAEIINPNGQIGNCPHVKQFSTYTHDLNIKLTSEIFRHIGAMKGAAKKERCFFLSHITSDEGSSMVVCLLFEKEDP